MVPTNHPSGCRGGHRLISSYRVIEAGCVLFTFELGRE
jgi:hypothetical protein